MTHWVLQSGWEHEAGWVTMLETLERFGIPYSIHKVIPFVGELEPEPQPASNEAICIGSYSMRHYAKKRGWDPGVFDLELYDFETQRDHWGVAMLNADSKIMAFKGVAVRGRAFHPSGRRYQGIHRRGIRSRRVCGLATPRCRDG